jgi:hypothetical protein
MPTVNAPDKITVEFLRANGEPVHLGDLGSSFMAANGVPSTNAVLPFRVGIQKKMSKADNAYYDYSQNGVSLPDGLATFVRVAGTIVPMGRTRPSKNNYPTREGEAQATIGGLIYTVTVYITESSSPFYVKIVAHKTPDRAANVKKAQLAPRGGEIEI